MREQLDEKSIFHVLTLLSDPAERSDYLSFACGDNIELREQLECLLAVHEAEEGLLSHSAPVTRLGEESDPSFRVGTKIGGYKLLEVIGEGGFGIVFMAEQSESNQPRVALKVIKAGMDTKQVIARFEAERVALGLMNHPNIAKVVDAGSTDNGRPYFVMELVRGIPVTDFCNQHCLSTTQRLDIFLQICSALQHAHQKGIIHRDIKPSNVLVGIENTKPIPKVIDFGVAKATQGKLTDRTLFTQFRQLVGTPAYMSPEQTATSSVDVDVRSDIYSLGVLLYELLSGKTPLDAKQLASVGFEELCRRIREHEPSKPSTRLSDLTQEDQLAIAAERGTVPRDLTRTIRGDLDWIVSKTLEKDRDRRYESASLLQLDIERYLRGEPVSALPPTTAYRLSKFMRRHRASIAIAATIAALLVVGTAVSSWQAIQAHRNAAQADASRRNAQASQHEAETARKNERQQRVRAEQLKYAADMNIVRTAIQTSDIRRAKEILDQAIPQNGDPDRRGWEWRFLYGQLHGELRSARPNSSIHSIAVSPDGRRIATAGRESNTKEGEIVVLDTGNLGIAHSFENPRGWVSGVAFSSDGTSLTVASKRRLRTIQLASNEETVSRFDAWPICQTPDGKYFVGMKHDERNSLRFVSLKCFDADTMDQVTETVPYLVPDPFNLEKEFTVSPDGQRVTVSCHGQVVRFFSIPNLKEVLALKTPGEVTCVTWSDDGEFVATGYANPWQIDVWRSDSGEHVDVLRGRQTSPVADIRFSPDGTMLAFSELHYLIHVWDLNQSKERRVFLGHQSAPNSIRFLPGGATLVSGGGDGVLKLWDVSPMHQTDLRRESEEHSLWNLEFSHDGKLLATSAADGVVRLFDGKTKRLVGQMGPASKLSGEPFGWSQSRVRFSSDGRTLVVDNNDFTAGVYDLHSQSHRFNITNPTRIYDLDISPDGNTIATAGLDEHLLFWDAQTGKERFRVTDPQLRTIDTVRFCPDNDSRMVAFAKDHEVSLMHLDTRTVRTIEIPTSTSTWSLDFSRDGRTLFCGCHHCVKIYDVSTLRLVDSLDTGTGPVPNVAESPDGNTLAIPGWGGHVQLWSRRVKAEVGRLPLPLDAINCARFSPDGSEIVVSTWGNGVFTFEAPSIQQLAID